MEEEVVPAATATGMDLEAASAGAAAEEWAVIAWALWA
jgi:hypothetical protein